MVVELVQMAFHDRVLTEEATWQVVVLIPKGGREYRDIGLNEVVWKLVAVIINCHFTASITYHKYLHGFRAGHGMGTATLEVKLLQKVAAIKEEVLQKSFLELHKTCDALDRSRGMDILEGYRVGPRALLFL